MNTYITKKHPTIKKHTLAKILGLIFSVTYGFFIVASLQLQYNLGSGEKLTIGQVVNTIVDFCEVSPEVVWDSSKPTTIPFKLSDIDRITKLGFKTDYTFKQGICQNMNASFLLKKMNIV